MTRRKGQDWLAGLIFVGLGAIGLWVARDYPLGTAARMGAGYFPTLVSGALALFGALTLARALLRQDEPIRGWEWRPMAIVLVAVLVFGFTVRPFGLAAATVLLVAIASLAGWGYRRFEIPILALALAALCVLLFVHLLAMPIRVWPA